VVLLYGECNQNATAASEEYAARFPNRRRPNPHVILRLISRARHAGSLNLTSKGVAGAPRTARVHAMEEAVLEAVEQDPRRSVRVIPQMCGFSKSTTHRIIKGSPTSIPLYPSSTSTRGNLSLKSTLLSMVIESKHFQRQFFYTNFVYR
jgi:hypothetical protein